MGASGSSTTPGGGGCHYHAPPLTTPSKLSPSELLFLNGTRVDSNSLSIKNGNKEWFEFVNMRNERKWKSSDMTEAQWRQATETFNARTSPHDVVPKKVSAVKKCLRDLEAAIEKRHAIADYNSPLCFDFFELSFH